MAEIAAAVALDHVQSLGVRMTHAIEPALVIETDCIDNKRVPFPPAFRVTHPSRLRIFHGLTIIKKDLSEHSALFIQDQDQLWGLDNLVRNRNGYDAGRTRGFAMCSRIVFAVVLQPLIQEVACPWLNWH